MDPTLVPPPPPPSLGNIGGGGSTLNFPPPHPSNNNNSFPVIIIAVIGILATAFLLVGYYVFVIKCCLHWHRIDVLRWFSSRRRRNNGNDPSMAYSPASAVTRGLEESVIRAIPTIRFRKETKQVTADSNNYECAVCLSEFQHDENLRVIPNCCHAFHIDCIDVWLQNNANCPLCRSSISANSLYAIGQIITPLPLSSTTTGSASSSQDPAPPSTSSSTNNNDGFNGHEEDTSDDDYLVIEIRDNNLDEPRLITKHDGLNSNSEELPPSTTFSITPSPVKKGEMGEQIGNGTADSDFSSIRNLSPPRKVGLEKNKKIKKRFQHVSSMGDECIIDRIRELKEDSFKIQPLRRSISMDSSNDRQLYVHIQDILQQQQQQKQNQNQNQRQKKKKKVFSNEDISLSEDCITSSNSRVRKSIFSFGNANRGGPRNAAAVLPLHRDS